MSHEVLPLRFLLNRKIDDSGVSGTGIIAEGVLWFDGKVSLRWRDPHSSVAFWESLDDMLQVHGHNGHTVIKWVDLAV